MRPSGYYERLIDGISRVLILVSLLAIAAIVPVWLRMIVSPAPQEMREGALVWSTIAFLHGQNPYALDTLPGPANVYGPLYPLVVTPLAWIMGPTLAVHRLVNNLAIVLACGILYRVLRGEGVSRLVSLGGAAINLAGLLYWVGPTARPDGLGVALLIAAYAVMAPNPESPRRFGLGLLLSLLGFAAKIYYVVPVFTAVAWIAWRRGARRGVLYGAVVLAGLGLTVAGLATLYPAWAPIVLGANVAATSYDVAYLLQQTRDWAVFTLPLLVAFCVGWALSRRRSRGAQDAVDAGASLWTMAFLVGLVAIAARLGGHRGAHMTYFFHLVTPPLTILALRLADRTALARLAFSLSLLAGVFLNAHWFMLDVNRLDVAEQAFARLSAAISHSAHPTATSEMAPLLLAAGVDPVETGHTQYFRIVTPPWYLAPLWGPLDGLRRQERLFTRSFYKMIDGRGFDLVIANRRALDLLTPQLLYSRYKETTHLEIDMPWARQSWPVDVWIPTAFTDHDDN